MIIIALGNEGLKYKNTRHNAGWLVVDEYDLSWEYNKYSQSLESVRDDVVFVKPQTMMNNSGLSAVWYTQKYNEKQLVILYDDIDLPIGSIRIAFDRGDAGHNGVKSIVDSLGRRDFVRIRIGIAPKKEDGTTLIPEDKKSFVLKNFSENDLQTIYRLAPKILEILKTIRKDGYQEAMNRFN